MKQSTLLLLVMIIFTTGIYAQKNQKNQKNLTGYAITASEKGDRAWKEVRQIDISRGEELQTVYNSKQEMEALNARTGKPVVKKQISYNNTESRRVVNLDRELDKAISHKITSAVHVRSAVQTEQPFATNSAAMAFDKKHERLYYTPMGINQLRYIDLKAKSPKVYYFEDDSFGALTSPGDAPNQITRMAFASDGKGYALTNNCDHLFSFTTGKKPVITDLGAITDDAANGKNSVKGSRNGNSGYGGDIIADASMNLYLITANRNVFKISIESKVATYLGSIIGLPKGFTTNGAMVEEGSKVIVSSAESTLGYYRVDLTTLVAEKASASGNVFNASDLANGNLAFEKKKKEQIESKETATQEITLVSKNEAASDFVSPKKAILVYPNPVTNGLVKLSFNDQPAGKYKIEVIDMSGKLINSREVMVNNKLQIEELHLGESLGKGNYMINISNEKANILFTQKVMLQ